MVATKLPSMTVAVGWDASLGTFFAQVLRARVDFSGGSDDRLIVRLGTRPGEIPAPEHLVEPLKPYAVITPEIIALLRSDQAGRAEAAGEGRR